MLYLLKRSSLTIPAQRLFLPAKLQPAHYGGGAGTIMPLSCPVRGTSRLVKMKTQLKTAEMKGHFMKSPKGNIFYIINLNLFKRFPSTQDKQDSDVLTRRFYNNKKYFLLEKLYSLHLSK